MGALNKRVIACLSGGVASAWCANWTLQNYPKENVLLYFNDTKWEHPDLYRFIRELSSYWNHPITEDSDGRTPEDVFKDQHMLANNRAPFCSRILKADRLQKYFQDGDTLVFGIGMDEIIRAHRLVGMYQKVSVKRGISCKLEFPLLKFKVSKADQLAWLQSTGIKMPELYLHGFKHNNCAGGCVRSGKGQWAKLLREFPEVYRERESRNRV